MIVSEKYFIGYHFVDSDLKLKNSSILSIFEDLGGMHSIIANESIKTSNTTWLLTAYDVRILKRPEYGDRVTVRTWTHEPKNYFASREFEILGENGEKLITAISEWVHVNRSEAKLEKCSPELVVAYDPETITNFELPRIKRLRDPDTFESETEFTVGRNLIDANKHMNNVYYLDLAEMALSDEFESNNFIIFYKKEIKCGEKVICKVEKTEEGHFVLIIGTDGIVRSQIMLKK